MSEDMFSEVNIDDDFFCTSQKAPKFDTQIIKDDVVEWLDQNVNEIKQNIDEFIQDSIEQNDNTIINLQRLKFIRAVFRHVDDDIIRKAKAELGFFVTKDDTAGRKDDDEPCSLTDNIAENLTLGVVTSVENKIEEDVVKPNKSETKEVTHEKDLIDLSLACELCSNTFVNAYSLARHKKGRCRATKVVDRNCPICKKYIPKKSHRDRHIESCRKKHGKLFPTANTSSDHDSTSPKFAAPKEIVVTSTTNDIVVMKKRKIEEDNGSLVDVETEFVPNKQSIASPETINVGPMKKRKVQQESGLDNDVAFVANTQPVAAQAGVVVAASSNHDSTSPKVADSRAPGYNPAVHPLFTAGLICIHCKMKFRYVGTLHRHVRSNVCSAPVDITKCSFCTKYFFNEEYMMILVQQKHENNNLENRLVVSPVVKDYVERPQIIGLVCLLCGRRFQNHNNHLRHYQRKHKPNNVKCNYCDNLFYHEKYIEQHFSEKLCLGIFKNPKAAPAGMTYINCVCGKILEPSHRCNFRKIYVRKLTQISPYELKTNANRNHYGIHINFDDVIRICTEFISSEDLHVVRIGLAILLQTKWLFRPTKGSTETVSDVWALLKRNISIVDNKMIIKCRYGNGAIYKQEMELTLFETHAFNRVLASAAKDVPIFGYLSVVVAKYLQDTFHGTMQILRRNAVSSRLVKLLHICRSNEQTIEMENTTRLVQQCLHELAVNTNHTYKGVVNTRINIKHYIDPDILNDAPEFLIGRKELPYGTSFDLSNLNNLRFSS